MLPSHLLRLRARLCEGVFCSLLDSAWDQGVSGLTDEALEVVCLCVSGLGVVNETYCSMGIYRGSLDS